MKRKMTILVVLLLVSSCHVGMAQTLKRGQEADGCPKESAKSVEKLEWLADAKITMGNSAKEENGIFVYLRKEYRHPHHDWDFYCRLGTNCENLGHFHNAELAYKLAGACLNSAEGRFTLGRKYKKQINLPLQKLVKLYLCRAERLQGQHSAFERVDRLYRQALQCDAESSEVWEKYRDFLQASGRKKEAGVAEQKLEKVKSLGPISSLKSTLILNQSPKLAFN